MGKPPFHGTFVDDHGVFHVVAGVGDDRHDGVGAVGVLVHLVGGLVSVLDNGRHGRLQPVHLVVGAVRQCHGGGAHGLLAHLALVHVSGTLVEITERGQTRNQRQHVHGVLFHVCHPTAEQDVRFHGGVHQFHPTHGLVESRTSNIEH